MNELQPIPKPQRYTVDETLMPTSTEQGGEDEVNLDEIVGEDIDMQKLIETANRLRPKPLSAHLDTTEADKEVDGMSTVGTALGTMGSSILSMYQGLENIVTKVGAIDAKANEYTGKVLKDIVTGNWSNISEHTIDPDEVDKLANTYKETLKIAKPANRLLKASGLPEIIPDIEETLHYWDKRKETISESSDTVMKGATILGDVAGFMTTWELGVVKALPELGNLTKATGVMQDVNKLKLLNKGLSEAEAVAGSTVKGMTQYSMKEVATLNTAQGVQTGIQEYGATNDPEKALSQAITAVAFGTALMGTLKGVGTATKYWHPLSSDGTKLVQGFERLAQETTYRGKALELEKAKQEFGKMSTFGSWDRLPNMTKTLFLATKSESGIGRVTEAMNDPTVFDAVMTSLRDMDSASSELLKPIKDVTKAIQDGKPIISNGEVTSPYSPTYLQKVLTDGGFIKGTAGTAKDDKFGIEWAVVGKILKGSSDSEIGALVNSLHFASNEALTSLKTGLTDVKNGLPPKPEKFDLKHLKNATLLRLGAKREGIPFEDVANGKVPNPALSVGSTDTREVEFGRDWDSIFESLKAGGAVVSQHLDEDTVHVALTPETIYKAYVDLQNKIKIGGDAFDATKAKQQAEVVLDLLDTMTNGAEFKKVIQNAVQAQALKRRIIDDFGLGKLMAQKANLTPIEIRQAMESMANRMPDFPKEYKYMIESLPSKEVQVEVETALIKALAISRDVNLKKFGTDIDPSSSTKVLDTLNKNISAIENFKPVTREGRVLQEGLKAINSATDGIVRRMIGNRFERSVVSEFRVGIANAIHRVIGSVQTDKQSINNLPYVANKLTKMAENIEVGVSPISGQSVLKHYSEKMAKGDISLDDVPLRTSVEIARMVDNLRKLQISTDTGNILHPYAPKPTAPATPTPTPAPATPTPKGKEPKLPPKVLQDIADQGNILDSVVMFHTDVTDLDDVRMKFLNNILSDKGYLPPATKGFDEDWLAYNKELTRLSKGQKTTVLIDPTGRPTIVLNTKGIKLNPSFRNGKGLIKDITYKSGARPTPADIKKGVATKQGYKLEDILDLTEIKKDLAELGKPDILDNIRVRFRRANRANRGGHNKAQGLETGEGEISTIWINSLPFKDSDVTSGQYHKKLLSVLQHEIAHAVQYNTGFLTTSMKHHPHSIDNVYFVQNITKGLTKDIVNKIIPDTEERNAILNLANVMSHDSRPLEIGRVKAKILDLNKYVEKGLGKSLLDVSESFEDVLALVKEYIDKRASDAKVTGIDFNTLVNLSKTNAGFNRYETSHHETQARFVQAIAETKGITGDMYGAMLDFIEDNRDQLEFLWYTSPEGKRMATLSKNLANLVNEGRPSYP